MDGNDASYRVQVGDTLPNEQECIAIFRKVTSIEEGPATRNTAVYFTRAGFSALADAQAYVMYTKSDEKPKYQLQSATNDHLKKVESLTFDSIPNKKLIVECLEAQGAKIIIYQKNEVSYCFASSCINPGKEIRVLVGSCANPTQNVRFAQLNITVSYKIPAD